MDHEQSRNKQIITEIKLDANPVKTVPNFVKRFNRVT